MKDLSNCKIPRLFEVMKSKGVTAAKLSRAINISQRINSYNSVF